MLRISRFCATALSLVAALSLSISPVIAAGSYSARRPATIYYPPPAGMTLTDKKPTNALALRVSHPVHPQYLRQVVRYRTSEPKGTVIVNTGKHYLYLVLGNGYAMRYGIGVARSGFEWSGTHKVTAKREWPSWTPPKEMIAREAAKGHYLPARMEGGPDNPLGARAMYLGSTLYRIHGTNAPWTIGYGVSSGCIRMRNEDVVDLYERVNVGTRVIVM